MLSGRERVPTDSRVHIMPLIESAAKLMLKVEGHGCAIAGNCRAKL